MSIYGPGPGIEDIIWDETTQTGFFGICPYNEFVDAEYVVNALFDGLRETTPYTEAARVDTVNKIDDFGVDGYYKFRDGNSILFYPTGSLATSINWFVLYQLGAIFGKYADLYSGYDFFEKNSNTGRGFLSEYDRGSYFDYVYINHPTIPQTGGFDFDGNHYDVRFMQVCDHSFDMGGLGVPNVIPGHSSVLCPNALGNNSEWNRLVMRLAMPSLYSTTCRWSGYWSGVPEGAAWAAGSPGDCSSMAIPFSWRTSWAETLWMVADSDTDVDYLDDYSYGAWRPVFEMTIPPAPVVQKFWTGYKGCREE